LRSAHRKRARTRTYLKDTILVGYFGNANYAVGNFGGDEEILAQPFAGPKIMPGKDGAQRGR
jgi:hypothetical protein